MEELESFSDGKHEGSSDESGGVGSLEPRTIDSQNAPPSSRIAIVLPELSKANLETFEDFEDTESNVVECVVGASDQGSKSFLVEFTDGRQVSMPQSELLLLTNGDQAMDEFRNRRTRSKKRKYANRSNSGSEGDRNASEADSTDMGSSQRSSSTVESETKPTRQLRNRPKRNLNITMLSSKSANSHDDDADFDTPKRSASESDDDFRPVVSDIVSGPRGQRGRRARPQRLSANMRRQRAGVRLTNSIEPSRRSERATGRPTVTYDDDALFEELYQPDKTRRAPKITLIKEKFADIDSDSPFGLLHYQKCAVCDRSARHGQLVFCQGCSISIHVGCLGTRSTREHLVTKVGEDDFALQCKYCINSYAAKNPSAPSHSKCQVCRVEGLSCKAFSERIKAKDEERIRQENGGVDPVTVVSTELLNQASNVLFRCKGCNRAWHQDHLPKTGESSIENYLKQAACEQCEAAEFKVHRIVAWRPIEAKTDPTTTANISPYENLSEDDKDYLIKWEGKSYYHCSWVAGSWLFGVVSRLSLLAFARRTAEEDLCKASEKDAISQDYLLPDVILSVRMAKSVQNASTKQQELKNISQVKEIYVKFRGLGYDDVVWDTPPTKGMGHLHKAFKQAYADYLDMKFFVHNDARDIRQRIAGFKSEEFVALKKQPKGIKQGTLMQYQIEGVSWLLESFHSSKSVVLADEMGLGKTVQVISFISALIHDSPKCWPFLIVVPNATCPNWRREFKQWTSDIRVVTYHGGKVAQELAYKYELFPEAASKRMAAHVVIMSYESAQDPRTKGLFNSVQWAGLIVDEGQRLKNDENQLYNALHSMRIPFKVLLTGTPLQNNTRELFNLLQFIDEKQNAASLDEEFANLTKENLPALHEKIRPYFLRRTKAGVLKFLPPMTQIIVPVTMTALQQKLSKSILSKDPQLIKAMFANRKLLRSERSKLSNILMQLRKCLAHPFVYSGAIEERLQDASAMHDNLVQASAKLVLLNIMLPKLREQGHRVLIFCQFLEQLSIMEDYLEGMGFGYRRLDGKMSSLEKQKRIDEFNAPGSDIFAFLLSTRAGGVGINLATADTVIIMDPDYNPHQDMQALSRAHRIGQERSVLCFQLMTKGAVEERIMQMGRKKMALDHALIENMDEEELEEEDIESLLRHGAEALFSDDYQKTAIHYNSASVDKLLDRSQMEQPKPTEETAAEPQFAYGRVWDNTKAAFEGLVVNEESEADLNPDTSVWDKILAQREEEARREAEANQEILGRGGRRRVVVDYKSVGRDITPEEDINDESDFNDRLNEESSGNEDGSEAEEDLELLLRPTREPDTITTTTTRPNLSIRGRKPNGEKDKTKSKTDTQTNTQTQRIADARLDSSEDELAAGSSAITGVAVPTLKSNGHVNWRYKDPTSAINAAFAGRRVLGRPRNQFVVHTMTNAQSSGKFRADPDPTNFDRHLSTLKTEAQIRIIMDQTASSFALDEGIKQARLSALRHKLSSVQLDNTAVSSP